MPKLRPETREERRQALIEAGWRCTAVEGFRDLTVDDVCAEAGVSTGAFYGYFAGKRELLLALLEDDAEQLDLELERIASATSTGVERLRGFARAMLARGEDAARVQVRADLWADLMTEEAVRCPPGAGDAPATRACSRVDRGGGGVGRAGGDPRQCTRFDPARAGRWADAARCPGSGGFSLRNIRRALDVLLAGIEMGTVEE